MDHTFDGRNLAPVQVGSLPQDLQGVLYIPGGCFGFLNHQHRPFINNSFFHLSRSMAHMTHHTNPPTHLSVKNGGFFLQGDHWNHRFKDEKSMHKEHLYPWMMKGVLQTQINLIYIHPSKGDIEICCVHHSSKLLIICYGVTNISGVFLVQSNHSTWRESSESLPSGLLHVTRKCPCRF